MKILILFWILLFTFQIFAQQQVTINFSVWGKNKSFDGELKNSDIEIKQGKDKLQIISVDKVINETLDIVLMIDASGSQEKSLEAEKKIAIKFVENVIKGKDRLAIVKFAQTVDVEQDFSNDISKSVNTIKSTGLQKLGRRNTSIWDSVQTVAETLTKLSGRNKKVIVLISDGFDNFSKMELKDVAKYLISQQIPVYSFHAHGEISGIWNDDGQMILELISKQTGGFPFFPNDDKELQTATLQTEQVLRQNFKVTFLTDNSKPNDEMKKVEISIVNPTLKSAKLKIIHPKGFFFPIPK